MQPYLIEAIRTPRGKGNAKGRLNAVKPVNLLRCLFDEMKVRAPHATVNTDEVILGCVSQLGDQGGNIAQTACLYADWQPRGSGTTVNSFCTSALTALGLASAKISAQMGDLFAVGGVESMSRVPLMSDKGALFEDPEVSGKVPYVPNGVVADFFATKNGLSRNDLDEYAVRSHQRAASATDQGFFQRSLVPIADTQGHLLIDRDELIRPGSSPESLKKLPPLFAELGSKGPNERLLQHCPEVLAIEHMHHAGCAPGIVDGASLALVGSANAAKRLNLPLRARIRAQSFKRGPAIEALTGGLIAAEDALKQCGLTPNDIDLWEFNEGFAGIVMHCAGQLGIDHDRLNVNGGGIAMGHAMGATGINLLSTLVDELERRNLNTGVVAISGAAGIGAAIVVDREC